MKTLGGYRPPTNTTTQRSTSCFLCLCNRRSSRPVHNKLVRLQSGVDSKVERQVLGLSIPMAPRSRKTRTDGTLFSSVLLRCYVAIKPQISRACATPGSTVDTLAQKTEMCQKSNARTRKTTLSQSHCNADYESAPSARVYARAAHGGAMATVTGLLVAPCKAIVIVIVPLSDES